MRFCCLAQNVNHGGERFLDQVPQQKFRDLQTAVLKHGHLYQWDQLHVERHFNHLQSIISTYFNDEEFSSCMFLTTFQLSISAASKTQEFSDYRPLGRFVAALAALHSLAVGGISRAVGHTISIMLKMVSEGIQH